MFLFHHRALFRQLVVFLMPLSATAILPFLGILPFSTAFKQEVLQEEPSSPFDAKFAQLAKRSMHIWHVPGISIAVVDGDDIWAAGYGIAKFPKTPATPSTLYYTGSTTKAFTTAAISLLIDNSSQYSNIRWDMPISSLLRDDFVLEDEWATSHITIEDALSHRTGMPRHDMSYGGPYDGHKGTPKDVVRSLRYLPMTAEPRTRYQYCNMMFIVACHLVETMTGQWLGDFLKERIWEPLGMKSTYFSTSSAQAAPEFLAQGYFYNQEREKYQEVPYMDLNLTSGAGAVVSNVLDYSKWLRGFLNITTSPISASGYAALKKPRMFMEKGEEPTSSTGPTAYCLGWMNGAYSGYEWFQHGGGMEAFGADVIFFPELKYGIVAFGNTAVTSNIVEKILLWRLIDDKLGIPEKERFDWTKKAKDGLKDLTYKYENAIRISYPSLPEPALQPSLPLQNYTGTYTHPAYNNMTIVLSKNEDGESLHADRSDAYWKSLMDLKHVSGDYFMAYVNSITAPALFFKQAMPAQFRIGSDGVVRGFGLAIEPKMGREGRIWFERV